MFAVVWFPRPYISECRGKIVCGKSPVTFCCCLKKAGVNGFYRWAVYNEVKWNFVRFKIAVDTLDGIKIFADFRSKCVRILNSLSIVVLINNSYAICIYRRNGDWSAFLDWNFVVFDCGTVAESHNRHIRLNEIDSICCFEYFGLACRTNSDGLDGHTLIYCNCFLIKRRCFSGNRAVSGVVDGARSAGSIVTVWCDFYLLHFGVSTRSRSECYSCRFYSALRIFNGNAFEVCRSGYPCITDLDFSWSATGK